MTIALQPEPANGATDTTAQVVAVAMSGGVDSSVVAALTFFGLAGMSAITQGLNQQTSLLIALNSLIRLMTTRGSAAGSARRAIDHSV